MSDAMVQTNNERLEQFIPRAWQMGVRYVEARPGYVRTTCPFDGNGNHFGVIYAGVTFTLAEVLGGGLHQVTFDPSTHYPLVKAMTIEYTAPGRGPLFAAASLSDAEIERIRAAAAPDAKVDYELVAEVTGEDGTVVARTRGDYQIRPFGR